jgi:hypothetical protein
MIVDETLEALRRTAAVRYPLRTWSATDGLGAVVWIDRPEGVGARGRLGVVVGLEPITVRLRPDVVVECDAPSVVDLTGREHYLAERWAGYFAGLPMPVRAKPDAPVRQHVAPATWRPIPGCSPWLMGESPTGLYVRDAQDSRADRLTPTRLADPAVAGGWELVRELAPAEAAQVWPGRDAHERVAEVSS